MSNMLFNFQVSIIRITGYRLLQEAAVVQMLLIVHIVLDHGEETARMQEVASSVQLVQIVD